MKNTRATVLPVLVFAGTLALAWGIRYIWTGDQMAPGSRRLIPVSGTTGREDRSGGGAEDTPEVKASDLRSVRSGLVVLPLDADPESIAAAFAAAWKKLSDDPGPETKLKAQQLFHDWLKLDAEAAIRFVSEPPGNLMRQGGEYLLAALADVDPERACAIAYKSGLDSPQAAATALKIWGSRDPQAAMAYAAALPSHQRLAAEMSALTGWVAVSGPEAFAWLQSQPESWRRDRMMHQMAVTLLQKSPNDIAGMVKQGSLPPDMQRGLRQWEERADSAELMSTLQDAVSSGADLKSLLGVANALKSPRMAAALVAAAAQAAPPKEAADVARLAASLDIKDPEVLLRGLGRTAPEAGLAWALENKAPLSGLAISWAEYDAKSAMQSLLAQPRGGSADEAARAILETAAKTAPVEAIEAAVQIPMPADQRRAQLSAAARILARSDPAQAVTALGRIPDAPPEEVSAVLAISGRSDAKAAAAALAQCDLNTNEYIASESLTRGWAVADPGAASEWVRTLSKGDLRDGGAAGLARGVMQSDPPAAFTWAMEINDATIRERVAHEAVNQLKATRSLDQLLADGAISETVREQLQQYWNRPKPKSDTVPSPATLLLDPRPR